MMIQRLRSLIAEMLDMPETDIAEDTSRAATETWDSLNHLQLVTALESEFQIKLTMQEIADVSTVGDLQRLIASRSSRLD